MARRLKWVPGRPAPDGVTYYMTAWHNEVKFSIAKAFVCGVEKYTVWREDEISKTFDSRLAALNHAETLI